MEKFLVDVDKINTSYIRMNLALAGSMTDASADVGQMIVMDMQDSSIVGHASLKIHDGEGGFVFRTQKVKEVNFILYAEYLFARQWHHINHIIELPIRLMFRYQDIAYLCSRNP